LNTLHSFAFTDQGNTYQIGKKFPTFIIAELSANHSKSLSKALKLLEISAKAGVNAFKLQTYTPQSMTVDSNLPPYIINDKNSPWHNEKLFSLYEKAQTPWEWFPILQKKANELNVVLFSTPFDEESVDFLEQYNPPLYKVSSFEIHHFPLLKRIGQTKKPVIISTGIADDQDIKIAMETLYNNGCPNICLLHCISSYPTQPNQMNLPRIKDLEDKFQVPCGLSDHSLTTSIPCAAVALGACVIEKHITLSRKDPTPDQAFSLEPEEFSQLVSSIREIDQALQIPQESNQESKFFGRSILCTQDIQKGETLSSKNIQVLRPSIGLHPKHYEDSLGKIVKKPILKGFILNLNDIE
jgi:pseudaminic acid synthase